MSTIAAVLGRILLAAIFVVSGIQKVMDPSGPAAMLEGAGLPANLALPTGIFELVAGLLLAIGLMSRLVAALLFVFVALTTLMFHYQITDPMQATQALKNLAIMGGLLMVIAYGQMRWSYDHWRERDRVRKAELRTARAEGRAEGATETHRPVVTEE
jgi:putative oxidoreductase